VEVRVGKGETSRSRRGVGRESSPLWLEAVLLRRRKRLWVFWEKEEREAGDGGGWYFGGEGLAAIVAAIDCGG
jgi:hypothetical protein